jgi:thymidylate kinase
MPVRLAHGEMPPLLAIEGPSGAGKSSVSRALGDRLGATVLPEAFERLDPRPSLEFATVEELRRLELRLLEAEMARCREANALRSKGSPVILDTGPWGPLTYAWGLRETVATRWDVVPDVVAKAREHAGLDRFPLPELTVYLDVPESLAGARAGADPAGHPAPLRERHRRVARFERILYERLFPELLPARFLSVAGEASPSEIARSLADRLERMGPLPTSTEAEADRLLDAFAGASSASPPTDPAPRRSPKR